MKIKSISLEFNDEGVNGKILCFDKYGDESVEFSYNPDYGWQQWGAGLDVISETCLIMRMIFEDNIEFVNDLSSFINVKG